MRVSGQDKDSLIKRATEAAIQGRAHPGVFLEATSMTRSIPLIPPTGTLAPPHDRRGAGFGRAPQTIRLMLSAWRDGLAAHRRYEGLRARGVPHAAAITEAMREIEHKAK
jgi:hypothetical protein